MARQVALMTAWQVQKMGERMMMKMMTTTTMTTMAVVRRMRMSL